MRALAVLLSLASLLSAENPPREFTVAFIADQGIGRESREVLRLIRAENADLLVHGGDFDYTKNPQAWDAFLTRFLGEDFPVLAVVGNHDTGQWEGEDGYQALLEARLRRAEVTWDGDLGVVSSVEHKGLFFALLAPGGLIGEDHAEYLKEKLAETDSPWRFAVWHKNMRAMQVGAQRDSTGWDVYEEARRGGAVVITGHEHLYCRTYLMKSFERQEVASKSDELALKPGRSFCVVTGLGGKSVRPQRLFDPWWACVYSDTQRAKPGALFAVFNEKGRPDRARFYFKDIRGNVADAFTVVTKVKTRIPDGCLLDAK